jgi:gamma-tubulin complex component 2
MFRHLFFAKHVERRLVGTWLDHQMIKEYSSLRKDMGKTYCLRQRMLHFMQNFVYYMMFEVIEPNFLSMESQLLGRETKGDGKYSFANTKNDTSKQQTVDDVLRIHNDFVRRALKECLLTNWDLIRTLTKLMTTCLLFSDQMKLLMEATKIDEEQQNNIANEARQKRTRFMYETAGILNERKEKKIRQALSALSQKRITKAKAN